MVNVIRLIFILKFSSKNSKIFKFSGQMSKIAID